MAFNTDISAAVILDFQPIYVQNPVIEYYISRPAHPTRAT